MQSVNTSDPEFLLLDVRENEEIQMADIPNQNEVFSSNSIFRIKNIFTFFTIERIYYSQNTYSFKKNTPNRY